MGFGAFLIPAKNWSLDPSACFSMATLPAVLGTPCGRLLGGFACGMTAGALAVFVDLFGTGLLRLIAK